VADTPWLLSGVTDGDTIEVARGSETAEIRLLGVDTPSLTLRKVHFARQRGRTNACEEKAP
jgi:endonuclease YncB( thermonuclease family)